MDQKRRFLLGANENRPAVASECRARIVDRDGGIRTRDPLNPIQVRYRAALRPVPQGHTTRPREQTTKLTALMFRDHPLGASP